MKIIDKKTEHIIDTKDLNSKFISSKNEILNINCSFLKDNFYLDSHNYFPLTEEMFSFSELFSWGDNLKYQNFFTKNFIENFEKNINNFKEFSNVFILGSSSNDNYYRNIITFLPRFFFNRENKIKLCIHRNSSNKFRNFIKILAQKVNVEIQFIFLDDGFYKFYDSTIPQFLEKNYSFQILNKLKNVNKKNERIYITRQNCSFRNLINESDVIEKLKKYDFRVVDLNDLEILEQIDLFSNSSVIVSATGSALTNLVFCNAGTRIYEIAPKYNYNYESAFKLRYQLIADSLGLKYQRIIADSINIENIEKKTKEIINPKILNESNYYKDLILKIHDLENIISF